MARTRAESERRPCSRLTAEWCGACNEPPRIPPSPTQRDDGGEPVRGRRWTQPMKTTLRSTSQRSQPTASWASHGHPVGQLRVESAPASRSSFSAGSASSTRFARIGIEAVAVGVAFSSPRGRVALSVSARSFRCPTPADLDASPRRSPGPRPTSGPRQGQTIIPSADLEEGRQEAGRKKRGHASSGWPLRMKNLLRSGAREPTLPLGTCRARGRPSRRKRGSSTRSTGRGGLLQTVRVFVSSDLGRASTTSVSRATSSTHATVTDRSEDTGQGTGPR